MVVLPTESRYGVSRNPSSRFNCSNRFIRVSGALGKMCSRGNLRYLNEPEYFAVKGIRDLANIDKFWRNAVFDSRNVGSANSCALGEFRLTHHVGQSN